MFLKSPHALAWGKNEQNGAPNLAYQYLVRCLLTAELKDPEHDLLVTLALGPWPLWAFTCAILNPINFNKLDNGLQRVQCLGGAAGLWSAPAQWLCFNSIVCSKKLPDLAPNTMVRELWLASKRNHSLCTREISLLARITPLTILAGQYRILSVPTILSCCGVCSCAYCLTRFSSNLSALGSQYTF